MRSRQRDKQNIWFSKISENHDDIDTVITYEKPIMKKMTVSSTSGTAEEISAGIVPNYDRYIKVMIDHFAIMQKKVSYVG